jgi:tetratricopeptide (TPR) repeat protein
MESFSKTLDTYTGSYVAGRRRKRLLWIAAVLVALVLAGSAVLLFGRKGPLSATAAANRPVGKQAILTSWRARQWDKVLEACATSLQSRPLDPFYLGFSGLASFYKASELPDGEERGSLVDQCVVRLRKVLVVSEAQGSGDIPRAELEYVLAKAYYAKGSAYLDESIKWMEASISGGYLAEDSREYLAVAYAGTGDSPKALSNFESVLQKKRTDLLLIAAGKAYIDDGNSDRGEALLLEALSRSRDVLAREKCRFILASVYELRGETKKAQDQIELVISENPESAEAHYRLGLIYQKQGDAVKARSEWRRAVAIDPMHAAARQKLTEKL